MNFSKSDDYRLLRGFFETREVESHALLAAGIMISCRNISNISEPKTVIRLLNFASDSTPIPSEAIRTNFN
jgi:hypothetical protein